VNQNENVAGEMLQFLDALRDSGAVNRCGAAPHLQGAFPELKREQARDALVHWMDMFSERKGEDGK